MRKPLRAIPGENTTDIGPRIELVPFDRINLSPARRYLVKGLIPRVGITIV